MKRIQFDDVHGVYEVKDFDENASAVGEIFVMDALRDGGDLQCALISDEMFDRIYQEYGIKRL